jgi:hypothetical protein
MLQSGPQDPAFFRIATVICMHKYHPSAHNRSNSLNPTMDGDVASPYSEMPAFSLTSLLGAFQDALGNCYAHNQQMDIYEFADLSWNNQ